MNTSDQFPSWWHKTVSQRSGHSFEVRSSGASSHFVPLHHDPATRSRCRSEETPRPAKRPRRKAGARAKRGVSELCHANTMDQLPNLEYKPAIQRSDCGFERRKTFAVEMNALARSSDIQRSFLSGAGGRTRTGTPSLAVDFESTTSTNSITPAYNKNIIVYSAAKSKKNFAALAQNGGWGKIAQF